MGTLVSYRRGRRVVVSTGCTQLGLIAIMFQTVETEETPFQRRLDELGKNLSIASLILVGLALISAVSEELTKYFLRVGERRQPA